MANHAIGVTVLVLLFWELPCNRAMIVHFPPTCKPGAGQGNDRIGCAP
jgi:hypothetical protein